MITYSFYNFMLSFYKMTTCTFDKHWDTRVNNNSWNSKDNLGVLMIFLILTFLISCFLLFTKVNKITCISLMVISLTILIYLVVDDPVTVLYPTSAIINMSTSTPEFLDKDYYFPNSIKFENAFKNIRNELDIFDDETSGFRLVANTADSFGGTNKTIGSGGTETNNWKLFQIKVLGEILPGAEKSFPTVVKILNETPEVLACTISILEPNVMIPSHVGYMKGVIRYMLPLKIPKDKDNCFLCVNKIKYVWEEGKGVLWDDTYPHGVKNDTDESRVVIYMDIRRKDVSWFANKLFDFTQWLIQKSPIIKDEMRKQEKQIKLFNEN